MNIYGEKVLLRAMEPRDMEMLRELANDPSVERMIGGWSLPVSEKNQAEWYERARNDRTNLRFTVEMIDTGEPVGMVNLVDIDWKQRSAFHGIRLGNNCPKGQGIGTDAVMTLMRYAFDELQLERLDGSWVEYNLASYNMYKKCGWEIEGRKENAKYTDGKYYSLYFGGILREKYNLIKKQNNAAKQKDTKTFKDGNISLRAIDKKDNDVLKELVNDFEVENNICGWPFWRVAEKQQMWCDVVTKYTNNEYIRLAIDFEGMCVGVACLYNIDHENSNAAVDIELIPTARDKAIDSGVLLLIEKYAFEELNLHMVISEVLVDNVVSRTMLENAGFKLDGILRNRICKDGKYHGQCIYSLLREEYTF